MSDKTASHRRKRFVWVFSAAVFVLGSLVLCMLQNRVLYDLITPTVIFAGAILGCVISSRDSKLFAAEAGGVVGGLMAAIIQFQLQPFLRYWGLFVYIEYVVFGLIAGFICAKLFERLSGQRQV